MFRSWPEDDRAWALAWQVDQDARLPCGCYPDETVGPEHDDMWSTRAIVCEKHRAIGEARDRYSREVSEQESQHGASPNPKHGVYWVATRDED